MASRKHIPPAYEGCSVPAPGLSHCGLLPMEPLPPELLANRLTVQEAEIQQLAEDNHRLAATHVALRQNLASAQEEIHKLTEHIRSTRTESDIRIRVVMDKIAKMEVDVRASESIKKDFQQAHIKARSLALSRKDLIAQIEQATQELEKAHADVKRLPEMHAELDSLRQERQRLHDIFEYEKGLNIDKVQRMRKMERDMVGMAAELEKLQDEVLDAEKRAHAPILHGSPYIGPPVLYPPLVHGSGEYVDHYRKPPPQMSGATSISQGIDPFNSEIIPSPGVATGARGYPAWRQDASHAWRKVSVEKGRKMNETTGKRKWNGSNLGRKVANQNKQAKNGNNILQGAKKEKPKCPTCRKNHYGECLERKGGCYHCKQPGHNSVDCTVRRKTQNRRRKHP